jgi:hypothetical protein
MNRPGTSPVVLYLQKLMREYVTRTGETQRAIGKAADVSYATVNNVLQGKNLDAATISKLAVFFGLDDEAVHRKAKEWWAAEGSAEHAQRAEEPSPNPADSYPTRAHTLDWARKVGYDESVIQAVASVRRLDGRDPGGSAWVRLLDAFQAQKEAGIPFGTPVTAQDEASTAPRPRKRGR